jgi:hypothetical protein
MRDIKMCCHRNLPNPAILSEKENLPENFLRPPGKVASHQRKMPKNHHMVRKLRMIRFALGMMLICLTMTQISVAAQNGAVHPAPVPSPGANGTIHPATVPSAGGNGSAQPSAGTTTAGNETEQPTPVPSAAAANLPALPPPPKGRSTVEGGTIRSVDPVRDQLMLNVYGTKPMKILYDERTQVYRDGVKAPLSDLHAKDHASVETVLDGTKIFAVSIHMLSKPPEGEAQGQVLSYDAGTGQLTISAALSQKPVTLHVPAGTSIVGVGQVTVSSPSAGLADLVKGTLVLVNFNSGNNGRGVATKISILAAPGSSFAFTGNVVSLDLAANRMVLVDPKDDQSYSIVFEPGRFPMSRDFHVGTHVTVTALFDGSHYVATGAKVI